MAANAHPLLRYVLSLAVEEPPWCTCALQDPSYLHPIVFGPPETLLWPLDSEQPPPAHTHTHTCVTCQNLDVLLPRLDIGGSAETFLLLAVLQFQPNQIPGRIQNFAHRVSVSVNLVSTIQQIQFPPNHHLKLPAILSKRCEMSTMLLQVSIEAHTLELASTRTSRSVLRTRTSGWSSTKSGPRWSSPKLEGKLSRQHDCGGRNGVVSFLYLTLVSAPAPSNGCGPRQTLQPTVVITTPAISHWNLRFPRLDLDKAFTQWATICRVGFQQISREHMC